MIEELKNIFIEICNGLGMPRKDPLMHSGVTNNIDKMLKDFVATLDGDLQQEWPGNL